MIDDYGSNRSIQLLADDDGGWHVVYHVEVSPALAGELSEAEGVDTLTFHGRAPSISGALEALVADIRGGEP